MKDKLHQKPSSDLHRLLRENRWVYHVMAQVSGAAKQKVKLIQSILMKRGEVVGGEITKPDNLRHPIPQDIAITDHALVRYLERAKGIDLQEVEAEMREKIRDGESYYGGAVIVDDDGNSYIMRDAKLVVSMMPNEWLEEKDGIAAETAYKRNKRLAKDDSFRALAASGIDTSTAAMAAAKKSVDAGKHIENP